MECDALFAESDDDVEVLPASVEGGRGEAAHSLPMSSNYADAAHLYELNAPLAHPGSAHTPIPEEYQPLPDSSSHLDYMLNDNGAHGPRRPDMNIRYQPKQNSYYYPAYSHYPPGMQPLPDYLVSQYQLNNMMLPHDGRNYMAHPLYTNTANPQSGPDRVMPVRYAQPVGNPVHAHPPYPVEVPPNLPASLERPSRKLNITPRRRQSKETDVNPNLIEVSSEEEDNNGNNRKRQYDSGSSQRVKEETNRESLPSSSSNRPSSAVPHRVDIKREPHDQTEIAMQAAGDADVSRTTPQSSTQQGITIENPYVHCVQSSPIQVKQEHSNCTHNHGHNCSSRMSHMHSSCGHYRDCRRHSPSHLNCSSGSHIHQHHRPMPMVPCMHNRGNSVAESSSLPIPRIKEEPETQPIKQEAGTSQSVPVSRKKQVTVCKLEPEVPQQPDVKIEPDRSSSRIGENRNQEVEENVVVKSEDSRARYEIDAAGDRREFVTSPQPGPSMERVPVPSDGITNNCCNQVSLTGFSNLN